MGERVRFAHRLALRVYHLFDAGCGSAGYRSASGAGDFEARSRSTRGKKPEWLLLYFSTIYGKNQGGGIFLNIFRTWRLPYRQYHVVVKNFILWHLFLEALDGGPLKKCAQKAVSSAFLRVLACRASSSAGFPGLALFCTPAEAEPTVLNAIYSNSIIAEPRKIPAISKSFFMK